MAPVHASLGAAPQEKVSPEASAVSANQVRHWVQSKSCHACRWIALSALLNFSHQDPGALPQARINIAPLALNRYAVY